MARQATIPTQTEQRNVRFRIVGAKPTQMRMMRGHAGMTRFVWNTLLGRIQDEDKAYAKAKKKGEKYTYHHDTYSKFGLCKHADALKREKGLEWLGDYSAVAVRGAAFALTRAYKAYREKKKEMTKEDIERGKGKPKFKAKRGDDWFRYEGTPIKCYGNTLQLPKVSTKHTKTVRLQRKGGNPYDGLPVKAVTVKQQGKRWYATVCYELTVPVVLDSDLKTAVGADLGVAQQVTLSNGEYARARDLAILEIKRKRHQRRAARQQGGSTWKKSAGISTRQKLRCPTAAAKRFQCLPAYLGKSKISVTTIRMCSRAK